MEVFGAAASFIAIGQALAGIPKLVKAIKTFKYAQEDWDELLLELELLDAMYDDIQMCLGLITADASPNVLAQNEPPYIGRLKTQLDALLAKISFMVSRQPASQQTRMPGKLRTKWIWKKEDISNVCARARKIQEDLHRGMQRLAYRHDLVNGRAQSQMIVAIHAVTTREAADTTHIAANIDANVKTVESVMVDSSQVLRMPQSLDFALHRRGPCTCRCHSMADAAHRSKGFLKQYWIRDFECGCDCARSAAKYSIRLSFPHWVARKSVLFKVALDFNSGIHASLSLPTTVKLDDNIWRHMESTAPKQLAIRVRDWSYKPTDENEYGRSLFKHAVFFMQWPLVLFWLDNFHHRLSASDALHKAMQLSITRLYWNRTMPDEEVYIYNRILKLCNHERAASFMIHDAVRHGGDVAHAIKSQPWALNELDDTGSTPLHLSCDYKNYAALKCLIEHNADKYIRNRDGNMALHLASALGLESHVRALIEAGNDIDCRGYGNATPLLAALDSKYCGSEVVLLLVQRGASTSLTDSHSFNALHRLCMARKAPTVTRECFIILSSAGLAPLINAQDRWSQSPLLMAIQTPNQTMTRLLLEAGALVDTVNKSGRNVLHYTAMYGTHGIMGILLGVGLRGIDVRTKYMNGATPLHLLRFLAHADNIDHLPNCRRPTEEEITAFERLLRDVRDRAILEECDQLESTIEMIKQGELSPAREALQEVVQTKVKARISVEEDTFRAIDSDVRRGDLDLAIESLQQFMDVSRARLKVSPFDEEVNTWLDSDSDYTDNEDCSSESSDGALSEEDDQNVEDSRCDDREDDERDEAFSDAVETLDDT